MFPAWALQRGANQVSAFPLPILHIPCNESERIPLPSPYHSCPSPVLFHAKWDLAKSYEEEGTLQPEEELPESHISPHILMSPLASSSVVNTTEDMLASQETIPYARKEIACLNWPKSPKTILDLLLLSASTKGSSLSHTTNQARLSKLGAYNMIM